MLCLIFCPWVKELGNIELRFSLCIKNYSFGRDFGQKNIAGSLRILGKLPGIPRNSFLRNFQKFIGNS